MGASSANVSRNMYDEQNRYVQTVLQAGVPVMDADYNDGEQSFYTQLRRAITNTIGDGSRGDAFLLTGIPANNDFTVNGGDLGDMGPETLYVKGHQATLFADETFLLADQTAPTVTGVAGAVLTNSAANYVVNELVGKTITPNIDNPATTFTILSNTLNTITTDSADLALAGVAKDNRYQTHLTTPPAGPDRLDLVYIDVYLDEIDATEDTNLIHTVDTIQFEAMRRSQIKEAVFVREGITLPVALSSGYVDADGNRHVQIPIALLTRPQLNPQITDGMITDLRPVIFTLEEIEARFVNAAGDTMTGPLVMDADIAFNAGQMITGICVVDSDAICPEAVEQRHFERTEHLLGDGGEVPTFSEVNDPADPGHFNVHDNRYYTKNQIENLIGTNLVENGLFDQDFNAWENATPQPLSGGPDFEAANTVFATIGMCGSVCSTNCTCRVLQVCATPGSRVCFICPVRQEVNVQCGGQFLLVNTLCVTKGDEFVRPYYLLDLYSSCKFVGTQRIDLYVPPADDPTKPGLVQADGFTRLEKIITLPACVDQVFLTPCYDVVFDTPLPDGEVFPSSPFDPSGPPVVSPAVSPSPSTGSLPAKCEVGPEGLEFAVCAVQMRRITGTEGEFSRPGGNTTAEPRITGCDEVSRTISFERGTGQVSTVIERLEEMQAGVRIGKLPTHFPGVVLQPNSCIDEADVSTLPVSTCNCSLTCTDPGGPLAIPECYLYGPENGNQNRGCPEITDEALGISVGTQIDQFLLRLDLDPAPVNFLQLTGANEDNTAVKFRLGRNLTSVFDQQMRVLAVDGEGRRAMYGFVSAAASAVRRITIPLSSFNRLDSGAFDWTQVTALYVGYAMGYFETECQFSVDNVWVCSKTDASTYSFENVASVAPHTDVNVDETCVTLQDFELESSIDLVICNAPMPTATLALDPDLDECTQLQTPLPVVGEGTGSIEFTVGPGVQAAPWGLCLNFAEEDFSPDASPKFQIGGETNRTNTSVVITARDSLGGVAIEKSVQAFGTFTMTTDFGTDLGLATAFDITKVVEICVYFAFDEGPQVGDVYGLDNWQRDNATTLLEGWNDVAAPPLTAQQVFELRIASGEVRCGYGVGLAANNTYAALTVLDPGTIPLVALSGDRTKIIAYWGQNEDTIRDADVVLVPAEFMNDPIVGISGNKGLDDLGAPLAGTLEALARDTGACYATVAFEDAPFAGCRNIWMDVVYLDEVECEGLTPELTEFEFFDTGCACITPATTFDVSSFATDECLPRILPDDEFGGLPDDYPEAINFEYCALPRLDRNEADGNEFFDFVRETPECARPDQGYYVRVTLRSKADGQTIDWIDALPAGHTLLSGSLSVTTAVLNTGEQEVHEYVVKTPGPLTPDVTITGNAELTGQPLTNLVVVSDPLEITENCPSLCFTGFGSQTSNVFGQVFWAGGGRADPVPAADVGLYTTVYAGSGSAAVSLREAFLTVDETVAGVAVDTPTSHIFNILPSEIGGYAVGQDVWIYNTCFAASPDRKIHLIDIENEESATTPDQEVTGLYGTISSINAAAGEITVGFAANAVGTTSVDFTVVAQSSIMIAPNGSKGFYWEASEKLAELCGNAAAISQCIIRWGYRFWNGSKYPCPDKLGASFVCDGDGETTQFTLHGDKVKDIINPRDWIDLGFSAPVIPVIVKTDVVPTDTTVEVCDVCSFAACDIVQIIDNNCTGQDGGGPGYVGTVVSTDACTPPALQGNITITPEIPSNIVGCSTFTGFELAEGATAFVKPDICRLMFSPTTKVYPDGTPVDGPNFVGVDFDTGLFTFDPSVNATNPELCFRETQTVLDFSAEENGIYFLVGVDEQGRRSPPSKPILLGTIEKAAPPDGYIGEIKIIRQDNPGPPFDEVVIEFCRVGDSTNRRVLSPPSFLTVSAASSGAANELDVGVLAPDTWYFIYAIGDSTGAITTDAGLLSLSPSAPFGAGPPGSPTGISPLMPPGYDCFRRIGSVRTLSSGDFNQFRTINRTTLHEQTISFGAQMNRIGTGGGGAGAPTLISAAIYIPPTSERAIIHATADTAAAGAGDEVRFVDGASNPTPFVPPGFRSVVVKIGNSPGGSSSEVFELGLSPMQEFWWSHSGAALGFIAAYARGYIDDLKHV